MVEGDCRGLLVLFFDDGTKVVGADQADYTFVFDDIAAILFVQSAMPILQTSFFAEGLPVRTYRSRRRDLDGIVSDGHGGLRAFVKVRRRDVLLVLRYKGGRVAKSSKTNVSVGCKRRTCFELSLDRQTANIA